MSPIASAAFDEVRWCGEDAESDELLRCSAEFALLAQRQPKRDELDEAHRAMKTLSEWCLTKAHGIRLRLDGNVALALSVERGLEKRYAALPEDWKF